MTSPVSPSDHVSPGTAPPAAQYAASRHAAWLGAAAIITDEASRILLVHPTYRTDSSWLLPGGVVESGEHPHVTCRRGITEELGLDLPLSAGPHWPLGKVGFIFDGGQVDAAQSRRIRLDPAEHDLCAAHDLAQWRRLMGGKPFARLAAVERARRGLGPHYLVTGP
ncbi:NUDIX domain-containing protein [Streptomyces sp. JW3]|uniref:NUDIX domain-containing protein n=1 Tax=Streptomyces sp. JW3 TaxID=3456955 RepID=UPI003FA4B1DF